MKKKLVIIVTIAFFLSIAGLPISLHFCEMQKTSSLSMCEVCALDKIEKVDFCCEEEYDFSVQLKSNNSDQCCNTKIIDKSISDNFISFKVELKQEHSSTIVYITDLISKQLRLNHQFINETASPPSAQHNDLYLQNSVLLI